MLEGLSKDQLIALSKHLGFPVKRAQRKNESFTIIYHQKYVDEGIFQELDDATSTDSVTNFDLK